MLIGICVAALIVVAVAAAVVIALAPHERSLRSETHSLTHTHFDTLTYSPTLFFLTEAREYLLTLLLASFVFGTGFCNIFFFLSSKP